jgi:amino acid adenylation domain-containing protein/non-ribosomal peptide synthase protein (TIGR01720 family)
MTIRELIKKFKEYQIDLSLSGDDLEVGFEGDELPDDVLDELRNNKADIVRFLKEIHGVEAAPIPLLPPQPSYELSSPQRRLWMVSQFDDANVAYNNTGTNVILGDLDWQAFTHACHALVERHEILRTVLREDETGTVRQYVLEPDEIGFAPVYKELSNEEDPLAIVEKNIQATAAEPLNLATGPLIKVEVYHVAKGQWVLNYVMHHIISDGWSASIFTNDISVFYYAYLQGQKKPLKPLRIQYKDYAAWQQQQLKGAQLEAHKSYWLKQFEGDLPVLELQGDRPRPPVKTYNGEIMPKRMVNAPLAKSVKAFAQAEGGTLFMALLTATNILLHRYTGQHDLIIGFPVAGRDHPDLEDQIGFYINTLALRTQFDPGDSARQVLRNVKQVMLGAYEHQVYPFEEVLENLNLKRDASRTPLFNMVVVLHNAAAAAESAANAQQPAPEQQGLPAVPDTLPPGTIIIGGFPGKGNPVSKFDITFNFGEIGDEIFIEFEYNTDIFNRATIDQMTGHMEQLLQAMTDNPDIPIGQLPMLSVGEQAQLTEGFNNTAAPLVRTATATAQFEARAAANPNGIAIVNGGKATSYQQLNAAANRFAHYLQQTVAAGPGDIVAVQLDRGEGLLTAILGVLKTGAAYLPIDPAYPADRIAYMVADSKAKLVVDANGFEQFETTQAQYSSDNMAGHHDPNGLAYVIYTSGSTGQPKGVMLPHKALNNLCAWHTKRFGVTENDRATLYAGVAFDASVWEIFPYLTNGASLYVVPPAMRLDMEAMAAFFEANHISIGFLPTQIAEQFMAHDNRSLRYLLTGGDKLTGFQPRAYTLVNNYGPTENTVVATSGEVTQQEINIPIGRPIDNVQVYILDGQSELCPIGVVGELCIAGDSLAMGYLNQPELTAEKFVDNPFKAGTKMYRTGDLCRWLPDGNIAFMGRQDEQVKLRGYRIELGEIETLLQSHPVIEAATVAIKASPVGEKEIVAYLVSKQPLDPHEVKHHLATVLPAYMLPAYYVQLLALPLTNNGKIDKEALPPPQGMALGSRAAYVAPQTEQEEKLIAVWEAVLGREQIGSKDNFFDLGGNSINSIQIVARLKQTGYVLTIKDVLLYPVVEDLARRMAPLTRLPDQNAVTGIIPLSPIQHHFFNTPFEQRHHYNQAVLLAGSSISEENLRAALHMIVQHHDALRMVYYQGPDGWVQENKGIGQGFALEVLERGDDATFIAHCERIQQSIDLANGPLLKAALFRGAAGDQLLLVIHHLVVDGVSWRILFEDLSALYQQAAAGQPLALPLKTDSFLYWQQKQMAYAHSKALQKEKAYWEATEAMGIQPIPLDDASGSNTVADAASGSFMLDEAATEKLLTKCYKAYQTEVNDILVTALGLAMGEVFGLQTLVLALEGHGRESIGGDEDITRTVGWFTSMYPVAIQVKAGLETTQQLVAVKETLHRVPNKGIGYGILRYLGQQPYRLAPELSFNYLGDFGSGVKAEGGQQLFAFSGDYHGQVNAPQMPRSSLLEVNGMIVGGKISMSVTYSHRQFKAETIEKLLLAYQQQLLALIHKLAAEETTTKTPVDFTYKGLSMEELEKLNKLK